MLQPSYSQNSIAGSHPCTLKASLAWLRDKDALTAHATGVEWVVQTSMSHHVWYAMRPVTLLNRPATLPGRKMDENGQHEGTFATNGNDVQHSNMAQPPSLHLSLIPTYPTLLRAPIATALAVGICWHVNCTGNNTCCVAHAST